MSVVRTPISHRAVLPRLAAVCAVAAGIHWAVAPAGTARAQTAPAAAPDGEQVYNAYCLTCHLPGGEGSEGVIPPLAGSEWVTGDPARILRILLHGLSGPVLVMGIPYNSAMPPFGQVLSDDEIAAVATYVRSSWGNDASPITPEQVAAVRAETADRATPWTERELAAITSGD